MSLSTLEFVCDFDDHRVFPTDMNEIFGALYHVQQKLTVIFISRWRFETCFRAHASYRYEDDIKLLYFTSILNQQSATTLLLMDSNDPQYLSVATKIDCSTTFTRSSRHYNQTLIQTDAYKGSYGSREVTPIFRQYRLIKTTVGFVPSGHNSSIRNLSNAAAQQRTMFWLWAWILSESKD